MVSGLSTVKTPQKRIAWSVKQKIEIAKLAERINNNAKAALLNGVPNESMVRKRRKSLPQLEARLANLATSKRVQGGGRKPVLTVEQECDILEYLHMLRSKRLRVTGRLLKSKASVMTSGSFKGSSSWLRRFKHRHNITLRTATRKNIRKLRDPTRLERVFDFIHFCLDRRKQYNINLSRVYNFDQTRIYFDMGGKYTFEEKGAPVVEVATTGGEKEGVTLFVGASATGKKLPLMAVFKGSSNVIPKTKLAGVICRQNASAWATSENTEEYIRLAIPNYNIFRNTKSDPDQLVIMDSFKGHWTGLVQLSCKQRGIVTACVPSGCTDHAQVMDTHVNAVFKRYLTDEFEDWLHVRVLANDQIVPKPTRLEIVQLAKKAWDKVSPELIIKGFKETGVGVALDGSEDHLIKINWARLNDVQ